MADCGVASRRECESLIQQGRVRVNGEARSVMPVLIDPTKDIITVDGESLGKGHGEEGTVSDALKEQGKVYYLLNKPKGILVTNYDPSQRKTVSELMTGVKERTFPVGRLDMDSRGALIMTNDGELANRLTHPRFGIEKTYIVEVDGRVGHDDLEKIKRGVWLGPERKGLQGAVKTERFRIAVLGRERGRTIMEVQISEAKNSEIRRVMASLGHVVRDLNRVSIAEKITLKGLKVGDFRALTEQEVKWLYKASSPEFHNTKRAATQSWYEAKEMEKERKRLAREAAEQPRKKAVTPVAKTPSHEKKEYRPRPQRKGKKPFVPPTGRNAGKPLGGNFLGRQRLGIDEHGESQIRVEHPLGDAAKSDE